MLIKLIVAIDSKKGIGLLNKLPWILKDDMKKFVNLTKGKGNNAIIMGKNTYISIGKPLKERANYIISTTLKDDNNINILRDFKDIQNFDNKFDELWVIGGSQIYKLFLDNDMVDEIYITEIQRDYNCDCFFPDLNLSNWKLIEIKENKTSDGLKFFDKIYKKINIRDQNKDYL